MASPNDNITIKDALSASFKMRAKDTSVAQDGSLQTVRHLSVPYPVDYSTGGCFQITSKSGTMAAGLAANSTIYAFRWTSATMNALVRRVRLSAVVLGTGFTAGIVTFDLFEARAWTVADTGGTTDTLTSPNGKLRASMAATALSEIRHSSTATLTAGTRTLDAQPLETWTAGMGTGTNVSFNVGPIKLFEKLGAEHPLLLVQNEGFVIRATVPATGTWSFAITPEWDEVPLVNY